MAMPAGTFPVLVPAGHGPGMQLMVRAPNTGQMMTVIIPQGVGPGGRLLANDSSRSRVYKLRAVLEAQGALAVETVCRPGQGLGRAHPAAFDAVLLDAPCSAEARVAPGSPEAALAS